MQCCVTILLGYVQLRNPQVRAGHTHSDAIHRLGLQYNHGMSHVYYRHMGCCLECYKSVGHFSRLELHSLVPSFCTFALGAVLY